MNFVTVAATFFLLYCCIVKTVVILIKEHFNLVFNFVCCFFFPSHFHVVSTFKENILVACIPRTADFMFVFLLTKLQERLVCLYLWYFNCSLCKLNYARNSM